MLNTFLICASVTSIATFVNATPLVSDAFNNATIQPGGPRSGANGTNYLNIEGANNGTFASFGVADFQYASQGGNVTGINSITLSLTEANSTFTAPGTLEFYVSSDTAADISAGISSLFYQANSIPAGVSNQLDTLYFLGTGDFTTTGSVNSGQVDDFTLMPNGSTSSYLTSLLNSGGTVRIVLAEDAFSPGIAATFAGFSNTSYDGPQLTIDATIVPEPASLSLLAGGVLAVLAASRRRQSLK
jgi:PEP-CTERM motif